MHADDSGQPLRWLDIRKTIQMFEQLQSKQVSPDALVGALLDMLVFFSCERLQVLRFLFCGCSLCNMEAAEQQVHVMLLKINVLHCIVLCRAVPILAQLLHKPPM